jgi:hypothetical protein
LSIAASETQLTVLFRQARRCTTLNETQSQSSEFFLVLDAPDSRVESYELFAAAIQG